MGDYEHGLLVYNKDENVVIDSLFKNYVFVDYGTSNLTTGYNYISIPNTNQSVLFAMKPPTNAYVVQWGYKFTGSTVTHARVAASGNCSIDWVVFKSMPPRTFPVESYGLAIYNEEGELTFSSLENYLKVRKFYEVESDFTPIDIENNYFVFITTILRASYRLKMTPEDGVYSCAQHRWITHYPWAVTHNYLKRYGMGVRNEGTYFSTEYIKLFESIWASNPSSFRNCYAYIRCSDGTQVNLDCGGDTMVNYGYSDNKLKCVEILDPIR